MKKRIRGFRLLIAVWGGVAAAAATVWAVPTSTATVTATSTPTLRINEVLASNSRVANGGTFPDIIELHNSGATLLDLSGKALTDDPEVPRKYVFPNGTTIAAGGYLVVYADSATTAPGLHAGFALDGEGDIVQLRDTVGNNSALLDSVAFGFQIADFSVSRTGAGANIWALTTPTIGAANGAATTTGSPASLRINEWAGNILFRLDHDMIELYNPAAQPVALGNVRLTDDTAAGRGFVFPQLSFIPASGFLPLYKGDYLFGLNGDRATVTLLGENNEQIDQISMVAQANDRSAGRSPDGSATIVSPLLMPSPGVSNTTPFPAAYQALLDNLRITEVMYQPAADSNASQYEFIELQNIGSSTLDLSGVRFTNGIEYDFPAATFLAPGAFIVVVNDRSSFLSRYPGAAGVMAPGGFNGALSNEGDTLALTLPAPWKVHILRFRYESTWFSAASGRGNSIVPAAPATATPQSWQDRTSWRVSSAANGSPGAADPGTPGGGGGTSVTARLSNLSVRAAMAANQTLIVGFSVSGGSRSIVVRGVGPTLASFGLSGVMADPRLELYNDATLIAQNDDWNNSATLSAAFTSVAAFPFLTSSRDAAFLQAIDGTRSVHLKGTGAGVALVELYDTGTGNTPRLVNVSARNQVGTGDNILIFGFFIDGTGNKNVLIRAIGPTLAGFGVSGALADPRFEVVRAGTTTVVATNDNWDASLAATFSAVGAFPLISGSRDAALVTSLAPGGYTVQVSGVAGGTGEGLVEIYEVP